MVSACYNVNVSLLYRSFHSVRSGIRTHASIPYQVTEPA